MGSKQEELYRLAATGEVMLDREVGKHFRDKPEDFSFPDIRPVLKNYDLIFLNLESPVSTIGTPHPTQDPHVTFRCHPDTLQVLRNLCVTVVSLGNNHILDYGEAAFYETFEYLNAMGIKHVGAGRNYEEANRPLLLECNGKKIAFLSHCFTYYASTRMAKRNKPGVSEYRIKKILPIIRHLSITGYQVIISLHWGSQYSFYPLPYQMRQARQMIDNGASLILGHGPHYSQGIENYKNGQIVYSLGNFMHDEPDISAHKTFIYGVGVTETNELINRQIYPVYINNHVPCLVHGSKKDQLEAFINNLSIIYSQKDEFFWKQINNRYFNIIVSKVINMRSLKFIFLVPISFYFSIGIMNLLRKLKFSNLKSILQRFLK